MITYVKEILEPTAIGTIKEDPKTFEELILLSSFSIAVSLKRIADELGALNENTGNMNSNLFHSLDAIRNNLAR